jgi:hypothetical protein
VCNALLFMRALDGTAQQQNKACLHKKRNLVDRRVYLDRLTAFIPLICPAVIPFGASDRRSCGGSTPSDRRIAWRRCQGWNKTRPLERSESSLVDKCEVVEYSGWSCFRRVSFSDRRVGPFCAASSALTFRKIRSSTIRSNHSRCQKTAFLASFSSGYSG